MAVARSQIKNFYDGPPKLTLGLGDDEELYAKGQYSGWSFRNDWVKIGDYYSPSFNFKEMKEILSKFGES